MAKAEGKKRIVVKVGTSTLTHKTGKTNIARLAKLASVLSDLKNEGHEIVLVSSGAIAVGWSKLGLSEKPKTVQGLQASAAVGQCELMFLYDKLFSEYTVTVSQLLFLPIPFKIMRKRSIWLIRLINFLITAHCRLSTKTTRFILRSF